MEKERLIKEFEELPALAQKQVFDFIVFLKQRHMKPESEKAIPSRPLGREKFIGMWKDRNEMEDSVAWVKNLRKDEWRNPKD